MVDSSTRCQAKPDSSCQRSFYCLNRENNNRSKLQAPMSHESAIARCIDLGGVIDSRINETKETLGETWDIQHLLWTGALRHNASHFRQQPDGSLIKPAWLRGSHRDFPATVHARITAHDDHVQLDVYSA